MSYQRILVAVDVPISEYEAVIEHAAYIARLTHGELWLLHVAAPDSDVAGLDSGPPSVRHSRGRTLQSEHHDLLECAAALRDQGVKAHASLVSGVIADIVLETADRYVVNLIVLGSHGHGSIYKAVLGSSTDAILRRAACPVMIVPAPGHA